MLPGAGVFSQPENLAENLAENLECKWTKEKAAPVTRVRLFQTGLLDRIRRREELRHPCSSCKGRVHLSGARQEYAEFPAGYDQHSGR